MSTRVEATIDDLYKVDGKAELVDGEIVYMPPTGDEPSIAGGEIFVSLRNYVKRVGKGLAVPDNAAFLANLPHRKSFSPDAAFYTGQRSGMKFFPEAPIFAAEVRSENDYGATAERKMREKRADYFAAGTQVVWDVDLLSETPVKSYRADAPDAPRLFHRGEVADAEPVVPGWTMPVDDLFV